jgi:DNA-directed RNA polymerase subunit E'
MFYKIQLNDHIRVPPKHFEMKTKNAVIARIKKKYSGHISQDLGIVIDVADVQDLKEGTIIPGDGAAYFDATFTLYTFKPEMQEVLWGNTRDIADFGAFMNLGPIEGMIHVSQTMDDFVSFSKDKVLTGKETKRVLRVNDKCRSRIIAVSFKDLTNPKIGLTMRQASLGRPEWVEEENKKKEEKPAKPKK